MIRLAAVLLTGSICAMAYVPNPIDGPALHREDFGNIQFLANQNIAAGLMNADGKVWITADSAPLDAINAAFGVWNGVSTTAAHFAPIQTTNLSYNPTDGNHVIVFTDDAYTRSFTNGVLAVTAASFYTDGRLLDTDIFFSPLFQFSTTGAAGTYDLQSVLTHELGHSLGANHTNILSATMYFSTAAQDMHERTLSADDAAFVSTLYPAVNGNGYGIISGVTTVAGAPLLGGAITAVDPDTGITVGGFSSVTDGTYSLQAPPGNYYVYVEPAANLNLYESNMQTVVFTTFQSAFVGGNDQPSRLLVTAGMTVNGNMDAASGNSPLKPPFAAIGAAGATGDYIGNFYTRSISVASGQSVDFLFGNPFPDVPTESNIQILGPATLHPGSLRLEPTIVLANGTPIYRFTLDIPALSFNSSATMVLTSGTDILTRSGLFILTPPPPPPSTASLREGR